MGRIIRAARLFTCAALAFASFTGLAASPEVINGISWLSLRVAADGSVAGETSSIATAFQARAETFVTLGQLGTAPPTLANSIAAQPADNVEYSARQALALAQAGRDVSGQIAAILPNQNADGGFGAAAGYASNALDTAFGLIALKAANSTNSTAISGAIGYLSATKAADGSFGINEQPSVYVSSYALQALNAHPQGAGVTTLQQAVKTWLVGRQTAGIYPTVLENALAVIAITGATTDTSAYGAAQNAVKSAQGADGSWSSDPYLTAIALRALASGVDVPPPPPNGTAVLDGTVRDGATGAPVGGASVSAGGLAIQADVAGRYHLAGIPTGNTTVSVTSAGYQAISIAVAIPDGSTTYFSPSLYPIGATVPAASLTATVVAAGSGQPIAGASVSMGSANATTNAAGSATLGGIATGLAPLQAAASGYSSGFISVLIAPGANTAPGIALSVASATITLSGTITDATTLGGIGGATIALPGTALSATTNAAGEYQIHGISASQFPVNVSAPGYASKALTVTLQQFADARLDTALTRTQSGGLVVVSTVAEFASVAPYGEMGVEMTIQNTTATAQVVSFSATLLNAAGLPVLQSVGHPFTLAANGVTEVALDLHNTTEPAGTYSILVQGFNADGALVVEGTASVQIVAATRISASIALDPPVAQAGATQPIAIAPRVSNHGNLPVPAGQVELTITLDSADANYAPLGQATTGPPIVSNGFLNRPVGGVYDAQGVLWILNGNDGKIIRVAPQTDGTFTSTVFFNPATDAPAPNPFPNPVGIAIDAAGNLYVLNPSTTVYKVDPSKNLTKITTNQFNQSAIASNGGSLLYVSIDGLTSSVISVDVNSQAVATVVGSGFASPNSIAVSADGTAYVSGAGNTIVKMSPGGAISTFLSAGLSGPKGLAITSGGDLLIADSGTSRILKATVASAPVVTVYSAGPSLSSPGPIALAADGTLFVGNTGNNSIALVPSGGGTPQPFVKSLLASATGMTYDAAGNLFAVGALGDVMKVDAAGVVTALNRLPGATSVAVGPSNNIIVGSTNGTLVPYPSTGNDVVSGLGTPQGMASAGGTSMYVAERDFNRVSLVDMATKTITTLAASLVNQGDDLYFAPGGDRYILNRNRIDRVSGASGATLPASGLAFSAQAFVANPAGGFYIGESGGLKTMNTAGVVSAITPSTPFSSLATGMALDNAGNVLVADRSARKILQVNLATAAVNTLADLSSLTTSPIWTMASDGAGGVFTGMFDGSVIRVPATGIPTLLTTLPNTPRRIAFDGASGIVYVKLDSDVRSFALAAPSQVTTLPIPGGSAGSLLVANGQVHVVNGGAELRSYTPQGALVSTLAGFDAPHSLVFDGARIIVADNSKTISVVPGQLPQTLADETVVALTISQGAIFGTRDNRIFTLPNGSRTYSVYYAPANLGLTTLTAIAARGDGGFSIASRDDERVLTIDASKQVVASYAGVNSPAGIAVDSSGSVYVSTGFRQIARIDRNTGQSFVYDTFAPGASGLAILNGQLHSASGGRLNRYPGPGSAVTAFTDTRADYQSLYAVGSSLYLVDRAQLKVTRWDGTAMTTLASGLVGVQALAVGADGTLYTGGRFGSLTRASSQAITQVNADLGNVTALAIGPSGRIYAGSGLGQVTAFDPVSFKRSDLTSVAQVANAATNRSPAVQYLTADRSEVLAAGVGSGPTEVYRITYTPPPTPPAAGTVLYSTRVGVPELAIGATQSVTGIPAWAIPFPGDFRFSIHRVDGVTGEGVNQLHVGPAATGNITVGASKVPPGNPSVHVTAQLAGADFVTVAKVDTSRAALALQRSTRATQFGADALGRIYFTSGAAVFRTKASGGFEQIFTAPGAGGIIVGTLPIDNNQNFYMVAGTGNKEIFGVSSSTLQQVSHNTLPEQILSIVRDSQDAIWALTQSFDSQTNFFVGKIYRVVPNGAVTLLSTGVFRAPYSLAIDGRDNLYVHTNGSGTQSGIFRVTRDGATSVTVVSDQAGEPNFEYEGVNMTGDCADNIFVTPLVWKKYGQGAGWPFPQFEEEHTIVQVNGTTGKVQRIFDGIDLNTDLSDIDGVVYDRFGGQLLLLSERWVTTGDTVIYRVPLTCGSISTDFHMVVPQGQLTSGYSRAPNSIVARTDGSNELVWSLNDLQNSGQSLNFDTNLANLGLGETRAIASEAFLLFQDTFVANQVKVPLAVPVVTADGLVDVSVAANPSSYPSNTPIASTVSVTSRDGQARTVNLVVTVTDAQNALVAQVGQQSVTVAAGASTSVPVSFNTGTYLSGSYLVKAQLSDPATGIGLSSASAGFDILADATSLITSISSDKQSYQPVDTVTLNARGKNVSVNSIASGVTLSVAVKDPSGATVFTGNRALSVLVPGALQDVFFRFPLSAAAAGQYTAELSATPAGDPPIPLRSTTFNVLSTIDTGSGVQGSLSVPAVANAGDTVSFVALIANRGNAALTGVPVTFRVINPATSTAIFSQTTSVSVAQGGEQPVPRAWDATGVAPGLYVVAATASFSGRDIVLGQANIRIGAIQPFSFAPVSNAPLSSFAESAPIVVGGILAPAPISVTGGEFQVGNGAWSGSVGTVLPGDVVTVRVATAATFNTTTTATLTIAGASAQFSATTINPDTTPDAFTFTALTNVALGTVQVSNVITVSGITAAAQVSITGGEYSINGRPFTTAPDVVNNGDEIRVRLTASTSLGTASTATLTISGVSGAFSVTTTAVDSVPDAFSFISQNNVARNTAVTSNTVTINGINVAVPVTVTGGTYSVNGAPFTSADGTIAAGNTVAVRQTSSPDFNKTITVVLTVGGVSGSFAVTTEGADSSPDPFSFAAQTGVALNTPITSNAVTIRGINTAVPISIAGGAFSVNSAPYTSAPGNVNPLDAVTVRQTSSQGFATTTTATLTVGDAAAPFAVTTKNVADITTTPNLTADQRVLVLIACKNGDDDDDDSACVSQRVTFLDSYLTGLGVPHLIVTTQDKFKSELRSGRYDTYWISGGAKKLDGEVASELVEAGFRGETLVIDGVHDSRNKVLDQVVGVLYKGKPSHLDTVTLASPFLPAGTFTPSGGKPIRVDLFTGVAQAKFNTGDPAIVTNAFGLGNGLLFAFDLVGTASAQPTSTLLQAVLAQSLDHVTPDVPATFTGSAYVPFSLNLTNGEQVTVTLDVTLTLPPGFLLVSTTPAASQSGSTVTWHTTAAPGATVSLDGAVRTPDASGSYSLPVVVTQTYGTTSAQVGTYPLAIVVKGLDTALPQAISALQSLSLASSKDRKARDDAVASLQAAQTYVGQAHWEDAIDKLADAASSLDSITVDMTAYRASVDNVMKEVERRWWAALPVCPSGPPCRTP